MIELMDESRNVNISIVDSVELSDDVGVGVGEDGLFKVGVLLLGHTEEGFPLVI